MLSVASECGVCCAVGASPVWEGVYSNTVSRMVTSCLCLASVAVLLVFMRTRSSSSSSSSSLFPLYSSFLTFMCLVLACTMFSRLLPPAPPPSSPSSSPSYSLFLVLLRALLISLQWLVQLGVCFFLASSSPSSSIRPVLLSSLACSALLLLLWILGTSFSFLPAAELASECLLCAASLCALLAVRARPSLARPSILPWLLFLLLVHAAFGASQALALVRSPAFACLSAASDWIYYALLAPLLCYACQADSSYWRQRGAMLQMLRGAASATEPSSALLVDGVAYIEFADLEMGERVGRGAFAEVMRARWQGADVAVKRYDAEASQQAALEQLLDESRLMILLGGHPNLVRLYGVSVLGGNQMQVCLVMEYAPQGSLWSKIHSSAPLDAHALLLGTARGVEHLHHHGVLHRDLKSSNVLLAADGRPLICDFGVSRACDSTTAATMTTTGTPQWTAPEVLRGDRYDWSADTYSFGVIAYELLTREVPFGGREVPALMLQVAYDGLSLALPVELEAPEHLALLFMQCTSSEAGARPPFSSIVRSLEAHQK